jgi:putative ABC transport system permease protein
MAIIGSMMGGSLSGGATSNENTSSYYTLSLRSLGGNNLANYIKIYPTSFDDKDRVTHYLDKWNDLDNDIVIKNDDNTETIISSREEITYNDSLEIIISLIGTMIDIITIALLSFTSLSLVVSTVMIGVITYVSVVERVKEIGIIRSLGGRKKDVSNLFNAETFIIGLSAGIFGIVVTYGLSGLINLIINSMAPLGALVYLPIPSAIIVVLVSITLTLISGLIPARAAAEKDPVVALRTE